MTKWIVMSLPTLAAFLLLVSGQAFASIPEVVHYQGFLLDAAGESIHCPLPVDDCPSGPVSIHFKFYEVPEDPAVAAIWDEQHDGIAVSHGIFHVVLGEENPITTELLDRPALYLSLNVNAKGEVMPRQRFVSTAYAVRAGQADEAAICVDAEQLGGLPASFYVTAGGLEANLQSMAYLQDESDPVFGSSPASGITEANKSNWSTVHGWGDHHEAGYVTDEQDPLFSSSIAAGISDADASSWFTAYGWGDHTQAGYVTGEVDPTFTSSAAAGISEADKTQWSQAHDWGDHHEAGYVENETDPTFSASAAADITESHKADWMTAYKWGDHSQTGYMAADGEDQVTSHTNLRVDGVIESKNDGFKFPDGSVQTTASAGGAPTGSVLAWLMPNPPAGYLECDGSSLSRTEYAALFGVLGTSFGSADANTFNLPDFRGEFLRGWSHGSGHDPDAGGRSDRGDGGSGDQVGTKQGGQVASHQHKIGRWVGPGYEWHFGDPGQNNSLLDDGGPDSSTTHAGGSESRPRNVNVTWIVKY
jgi:hypothetical protein